jgi:hypothetical protein
VLPERFGPAWYARIQAEARGDFDSPAPTPAPAVPTDLHECARLGLLHLVAPHRINSDSLILEGDDGLTLWEVAAKYGHLDQIHAEARAEYLAAHGPAQPPPMPGLLGSSGPASAARSASILGAMGELEQRDQDKGRGRH